jgi:hypothetical protein
MVRASVVTQCSFFAEIKQTTGSAGRIFCMFFIFPGDVSASEENFTSEAAIMDGSEVGIKQKQALGEMSAD